MSPTSSSSRRHTSRGRLNTTITALAAAALALSNNSSILVSASPAPQVVVNTVPPVIGTDLMNNTGTDNTYSNSTTSTSSSTSTTTTPTGTPSTNSTTGGGGVIALPLRHVELGKGLVSGSIARRYFSTDVLSVFSAAYLAEISFPSSSSASDSQTVEVLLDTGSFELFVNPVCSTSDVPDLCEQFGSYNVSASPSSEELGSNFTIAYGGGSASGEYYVDSITLGSGVTVLEQQFGVATQSEHVWFGIMGLGQGRVNDYIKYPLLLDTLQEQGFTDSRLFSLELGAQPSLSTPIQYTGEIVFGGLDRNKFAGNLLKIPTDPTQVYYSINLTSITNTPASGVSQLVTRQANSRFPVPVIVDSGTTLSILPRSLVESLAAKFPGAAFDGAGGYTVPCNLRSQQGFVTFGFGNTSVAVSYADFIWVSGNTCFLGASYSAALPLYILGASFLRGAYVVFDQDNDALYMGQYQNCGDGESDLVSVPQGVDAAASVVGACSNVQVPPAATSVTNSATNSAATTTSTTTTSTLLGSITSSSNSISATITTFSLTATPTGLGTFVSPTITSAPTSSSGVGNSGAGGPAIATTLTSTITVEVVYTVSSCVPGVAGCAIGQVATSSQVTVTEICLDAEGNTVTPSPIVAAAAETTLCPEDEEDAMTVLPVTAVFVSTTTPCPDDLDIAAAAETTTPCLDDFDIAAAAETTTSCPDDEAAQTIAAVTAVVPGATTTSCSEDENIAAITANVLPDFTSMPRPIMSALPVPNSPSSSSVDVLFAYTSETAAAQAQPTAQTVTGSVIALPIPTAGASSARDTSMAMRRRRAGGRGDDGGIFAKVDIKLAAGVMVAVLGAWL